MSRKVSKRSLKMMFLKFFTTFKILKNWRKELLDFTKSMLKKKSKMNKAILIFIENMQTREDT
jgi:hypothetical protein